MTHQRSLIRIIAAIGLLAAAEAVRAQTTPAANPAPGSVAVSGNTSADGERKGIMRISDRLFPVPAGANPD